MTDLRAEARALFAAALEAVEPEAAVRRALRRDGSRLIAGGRAYDLGRFDRVLVVGAGKAGAPMVRGVEAVLDVHGGLVVVPYGHAAPTRAVPLREARHPIPDDAGLAAAEALLALADTTTARDLVIAVISGGGSALLPAPADGVSLADLARLTDGLLASGADIHAINAERRRLSRIAGGRLAARLAPSTVLTLVISDVPGDDLATVASGPTLPGSHAVCVARNADAMEAARAEAARRGWRTVLLPPVAGEARDVGRAHAERLKSLPPGTALLGGGETTVTLRGHGTGGRNQEVALAAALALEGLDGVLVLAAGTDGRDGPTEVAGAVADGATAARARSAGLDPEALLRDNDSHPLFAALGDHVVTGPTRTNVMDVHVLLRD